MAEKNLFWKGMFLGAIAGGALSLLDKQTRNSMKQGIKATSSRLSYIVQNSGEISEKVKETTAKLKTTIQQVSEDISTITGKVDELRELTPEVSHILTETKEVFIENEGSHDLEGPQEEETV